MTEYLLDTNVLAEEVQARPDPHVTDWLTANRSACYTTALNIAELALGARRLALGRKRTALESWLENLGSALEGRILSFNQRVAFVWADLHIELERSGKKMPVRDGYVAAIALRHGLTVATRNVRDFQRTGIHTVNPFETVEGRA